MQVRVPVPARWHAAPAAALAALSVLLAPAGASAQQAAESAPTVEVAGIELQLALPEGSCLLDRTHPADVIYIESQERANAGANAVVGFFVDCAERAALRAGEMSAFSAYGLYLAQLIAGGRGLADVRPIEGPGRLFLDEVARGLGAEEPVDVEAAAANMGTPIEGLLVEATGFDETRMLGPAYRDRDAVGVAIAVQVAGPPSRLIGSVAGITVIGGLPLSLNLYREVGSTREVTEMAAESRALVDRFRALNAEAGDRNGRNGWPWWWATAIVAGSIGLASGALSAALRMRRRRR